jgi:hypothetical protein
MTQDQKALTMKLHSLLKGGGCPMCAKTFTPNGTGNEGNKIAHWFLALMPWDEILQELAVPMHDWRCHIGNNPLNISFNETTAEFRKNVREAVYIWCTSRWYRKFFYRTAFTHLDEIYAFAVGKTCIGKEAYDKDSCLY